MAPLEDDFMLPAIAIIVCVDRSVRGLLNEVSHHDFGGQDRRGIFEVLQCKWGLDPDSEVGPGYGLDHEIMKVFVQPAHGVLDGDV